MSLKKARVESKTMSPLMALRPVGNSMERAEALSMWTLPVMRDRKSTRLNSSHLVISYAVFCLNNARTTPIYPLSLHDALPIYGLSVVQTSREVQGAAARFGSHVVEEGASGVEDDVAFDGAEAGGEFDGAGGGVVDVDFACDARSEEHTSELQSPCNLVCRLLLE